MVKMMLRLTLRHKAGWGIVCMNIVVLVNVKQLLVPSDIGQIAIVL